MVSASFKPKNFSLDETFAHSFVFQLRVQDATWLAILSRLGIRPQQTNSSVDIRNAIIPLLINNVIKVYPLPHLKRSTTPIYPSISMASKKILNFIPSSMLLTKSIPNTKKFTNNSAAETYIQQLALSDEQLLNILNALDIPSQSSMQHEMLVNLLINALSQGHVIAVEQENQNSPQKEKEQTAPATGVGNQPVSLGPHAKINDREFNEVAVTNKPNNAESSSDKPSDKNINLAKTKGSTPQYIEARVNVATYYLENNGFSEDQLYDAIGSPDGTRIGGVDLSEPLEVVNFPPPENMSQYVKSHGYPGSWFDPKGGQSADSLGISSEGRKLAVFKVPEGSGLLSYSKPILDNWTNNTNPIQTNGGGQQLLVNDTIKNKIISINGVGN